MEDAEVCTSGLSRNQRKRVLTLKRARGKVEVRALIVTGSLELHSSEADSEPALS